MKRKKVCHMCGKVVAMRNINNNKFSYPHNCPHGRRCDSSIKGLGEHQNSTRCKPCQVRLKEIEMKRRDRIITKLDLLGV